MSSEPRLSGSRLADIATQIPPSPSLLTPRQKAVAVIVAVLSIASVIALAALRFALLHEPRRYDR